MLKSLGSVPSTGGENTILSECHTWELHMEIEITCSLSLQGYKTFLWVWQCFTTSPQVVEGPRISSPRITRQTELLLSLLKLLKPCVWEWKSRLSPLPVSPHGILPSILCHGLYIYLKYFALWPHESLWVSCGCYLCSPSRKYESIFSALVFFFSFPSCCRFPLREKLLFCDSSW